MNSTIQKKYNDSINLISHLILTKPAPVIGLLAKHGTTFKGTPERNQITEEVVELLKTNKKFENDLSKLLTVHIQYRGKEMLDLEQSEFSSYQDEDQEEDEFWGALAKGAVGIIGGLVGKKKKRRSKRSGGNTTALAASQAATSRQQAAQAKRDMQMQMERMRKAEEARRREEAERRRREEIERRKREDEAKKEREKSRKKQTNTMLMVGGGIALLAVVGIVLAKSNSPRPPIVYASPQRASNR